MNATISCSRAHVNLCMPRPFHTVVYHPSMIVSFLKYVRHQSLLANFKCETSNEWTSGAPANSRVSACILRTTVGPCGSEDRMTSGHIHQLLTAFLCRMARPGFRCIHGNQSGRLVFRSSKGGPRWLLVNMQPNHDINARCQLVRNDHHVSGQPSRNTPGRNQSKTDC